MRRNSLYIRIVLLTVFSMASSICSELLCNDMTTQGYEIDCQCYTNNFSANYMAIQFYVRLDPANTRYDFEFEEMSGDLDIDQFDMDIETGDWYHDAWGYYAIYPYNVRKKINLEFTVFVEDITVSGTAGTLCNTSRSYSISAPSGYSTSWSFSNSNLVTSSSGSGTSASLTGSCNGIGDGILTFTMTKASCPSFTATRTINVNGPKASDLSFRALYTNGNPAPKSGSTYLLCPNTHYHIYLDNAASASCGVSNLTWTIPAGWTKNYQSSNMISIYTNSSPGGQVIVKGQTCCCGCGSNMSLTTGYFGVYYSCGGYYMASPNPGSNYIDIDFTPDAVEMKSTSSSMDLEVKLVDKMGTVISNENVYSFPHRINTSKLPEGNYVVLIRDKKLSSKAYDSFQVLIEH